MTATRAAGTTAAGTTPAEPVVDLAPLRRRRRQRALLHVAAVAITLFMGLPVYLITLAAFSSRRALNAYPKSFLPTDVSTGTMRGFLGSTGIVPSFLNSVAVGLLAVALALGIGAPAGYAVARYAFRGREPYQLLLLITRALPVVVLSIPLAELFLNWRLYDTVLGIALMHTALALPTTVLISAAVFVAVPREMEEAALVFGCTAPAAFRRVVLPMALPGIAASSIFTFVLSWNEVLGAAILALRNRTLPAQVFASLSTSPLAYRFAGGFAMVVPALLFIFVMRRYLLNMWGSTIR